MKKTLTIKDIQQMSAEERDEMNKKLAVKAVKRIFTYQAIKWGLIFGVAHIARKYVESYPENKKS